MTFMLCPLFVYNCMINNKIIMLLFLQVPEDNKNAITFYNFLGFVKIVKKQKTDYFLSNSGVKKADKSKIKQSYKKHGMLIPSCVYPFNTMVMVISTKLEINQLHTTKKGKKKKIDLSLSPTHRK